MRARRLDYAGADWFITNRGIGQRAVFETRADVHRFYDALEAVIALDLIEVFAFVLMTNHFHLLVRSRKGEISRAMKLVLNEFVRRWNATRRRRGSLFERRFHGVLVRDAAHWEAVLRYIDLNPVRAGMSAIPSDHPYGSARAYRYDVGPQWLSRPRVISTVKSAASPSPYSPRDYDRYACAADAEVNAYLVERLAKESNKGAPPLQDLIHAANLRQQGWMEWRAALADGVAVGAVFLPPGHALRAARVAARVLSSDQRASGRRNLERELSAGMLTRAAGRSLREISFDLGVARSTAHRVLQDYDSQVRTSSRYADVVGRALQNAVRRALPAPAHPLELRRHVIA